MVPPLMDLMTRFESGQISTGNFMNVLDEINTDSDQNVETAIDNLRKMLNKAEAHYNNVGGEKIQVYFGYFLGNH